MPVGDVTNINDSPIGSEDYRPPVDNDRLPSEGDVLTYDSNTKNYYPAAAVQTNAFIATDDAGDGTVADDVNNTDFTGQSPVIGQAAHIILNSINTFVHKDVAYNWIGPTDVTVGIGGSYIATSADFAGIGTADHALLSSRTAADQHPTSAITGLDQKQSDQDAATALVQTNLDAVDLDLQTHKLAVPAHDMSQIGGLAADQQRQDQALADHKVGTDEHPITSITGLVQEQAAQDAATAQVQTNLDQTNLNLANHLADTSAECHDQYATEAAALDAFVAAGYGGIGVNTPTAMPTIGATWEVLTGFDLELFSTTKFVTHDVANNGIRFLEEGVWMAVVKVTLTFAEAQAGRAIQLRLYDADLDTPSGVTFNYFVGRNQSGVNLNLTMAFETTEASEGNLIQLQVSSPSDSYTSVSNLGTIFQVIHVSEAKFLAPV